MFFQQIHIQDQLYKSIERARADKDLQKHMATVLRTPVAPKQTPEEFANLIDREFARALVRNHRKKSN